MQIGKHGGNDRKSLLLTTRFSYPDMEEIDEKTWQAFLRKIIRETDYEVIILDLTEQVRGLFSLLELCDEIYSCIPKDGLAMAKMEQYKKLLSHIKKRICFPKRKNAKYLFLRNFPIRRHFIHIRNWRIMYRS